MSILGRVFEVCKFWPLCFGRFLMLLVRPIWEKGAKNSRSQWQKVPPECGNIPEDCEPQVRQLVTFFADFWARENLELFVFAVLGLDRFMRSGPKLSPLSKKYQKSTIQKQKRPGFCNV